MAKIHIYMMQAKMSPAKTWSNTSSKYQIDVKVYAITVKQRQEKLMTEK